MQTLKVNLTLLNKLVDFNTPLACYYLVNKFYVIRVFADKK
jgi:hypothetical protein